MSKVSSKLHTVLAPVPPAMVTCGPPEKPSIITIAWTGIASSFPPVTYVSVRRERFSHHLIQETGEFVINLTTRDLVWACDYCGVNSGAKVDKFQETGLTPAPAQVLKTPLIAESPLNLECRVRDCISFGGDMSHDMFLADIVHVHVDERYIDENGKINLAPAGLAAYAHSVYYDLGPQIGYQGYSNKK